MLGHQASIDARAYAFKVDRGLRMVAINGASRNATSGLAEAVPWTFWEFRAGRRMKDQE